MRDFVGSDDPMYNAPCIFIFLVILFFFLNFKMAVSMLDSFLLLLLIPLIFLFQV